MRLFSRFDRNDSGLALALFGSGNELHDAGLQSEQRVVSTHADVFAGLDLGAALTNDDVACKANFTTVDLYAEVFGI